MHGMVIGPVFIWSENQAAENGAHDPVGAPGFEEGSVTTIMEDDKDPDQEAGCQEGEGQCEPVRNAERAVHGIPQDQVWDKGIEDLPDTFFDVRPIIFAHYAHPIFHDAKVGEPVEFFSAFNRD